MQAGMGHPLHKNVHKTLHRTLHKNVHSNRTASLQNCATLAFWLNCPFLLKPWATRLLGFFQPDDQ